MRTDTKVENDQVVQDRVLSHSRGFVESVKAEETQCKDGVAACAWLWLFDASRWPNSSRHPKQWRSQSTARPSRGVASRCSRKLDLHASGLKEEVSRRTELEVSSIRDPLSPRGSLAICIEEKFSQVTSAEAAVIVRVGATQRMKSADGVWFAVGWLELVSKAK